MADPIAAATPGTPVGNARECNSNTNTRRNRKRESQTLRIGLLGCGAVNSTVARMIADQRAGPAVLRAILVRRERSREEIRSMTIDPGSQTDSDIDNNSDSDNDRPSANNTSSDVDVECTTDADRFFAGSCSDWTLCIEAAGQQAVRDYGRKCLESGRDLMITSIGALTDDDLYRELQSAAEANGTRLILCTGSMPALDWMGAAALGECGCEDDMNVTVTQIKPPKAWLGTPAADHHPDLLSLSEPRVLFEGSSRRAASLYPKNANVAAMLALATVGLDRTETRLLADPRAKGNRIELSLRGAAGTIAIQVEATPSKTNPRTSAIVALSVVKAIRKLSCPVVVGL
eukprot:jgi/Psemu1/33479/gm1.33479_g